jgi:hypothetical protein
VGLLSGPGLSKRDTGIKREASSVSRNEFGLQCSACIDAGLVEDLETTFILLNSGLAIIETPCARHEVESRIENLRSFSLSPLQTCHYPHFDEQSAKHSNYSLTSLSGRRFDSQCSRGREKRRMRHEVRKNQFFGPRSSKMVDELSSRVRTAKSATFCRVIWTTTLRVVHRCDIQVGTESEFVWEKESASKHSPFDLSVDILRDESDRPLNISRYVFISVGRRYPMLPST